jgi:RNA polymerase sigma-70 factor (ECF subfamily)
MNDVEARKCARVRDVFAVDSHPMDVPAGEITKLLHELNRGNQSSASELFSMIYQDLHTLAASYMRNERPDHTLQATALVHEAYLRLFNGKPFHWDNRKQLFGTMAYIMRNLLVDHARKHRADKRGGIHRKLSLDEALVASDEHPVEIIALDEALQELGRLNQRQVNVVELRYFAGLTVEETAAMLEVSPETVKLDWRFAKAWLSQRLGPA